MIFSRPVPFKEAVALLQRQGMLPSNLSAARLAEIEASIRQSAMFSARVTDEHFLQLAHNLISQIVDPGLTSREPGSYMDRAKFRELTREYLKSIGYTPEAGKEGTIQDLASDGRLNLIADMRTQFAQGHAQHAQSNAPGAIDAFPCQELFRLIVPRGLPRDWPARWTAAGGQLYHGRMVARKDDPIWTRISRFETPYPPFDYNSGMWTKPVSRRIAVALGVITPEEVVPPTVLPFAPDLRAGVRGHAPALVEAAAASLRAKGIKVEVRDGALIGGV